jgi:chaperonin GroEL
LATSKENKVIVNEELLREKLLEGAKAVHDAVSTTYGPRGMNFLLEKGFGRPVLTRDGVTVARDVFFSDRAKNMGAQLIIESSEAENRTAGDGSSATVILTYNLMKNGIKAIAAGYHPMEIRDVITKDSHTILEALENIKIPVEDNQLKDVATVSAGDPLIGQLISEAILYVGADGGILTEKALIDEVEREYIDGYFLQSGFTAIQAGKKELSDPYVIVSEKRLTSGADAIDILTGIAKTTGMQPGQISRILFIGNIEDAAYNTIIENINRGLIDAVIIKTPPMFGEMGKQLLRDVAIYAGCDVITDSANVKMFNEKFIGQVDKVVASKSEATLFADNQSEPVRDRVQELKDQIEVESVDSISEKLRDRVSKLEGKVAIFRIGGATDTEKEELEFRIEDAINSTRHAYEDGIVPGGGVTLIELSKLDISDIFKDALRDTFKRLITNANYPADVKLNEIMNAPKGQGYNLRVSDQLVDVVKDGVIDAYITVREIVKNSASAAGNAITVGGASLFEDKE